MSALRTVPSRAHRELLWSLPGLLLLGYAALALLEAAAR
jgi:hypothetical protein